MLQFDAEQVAARLGRGPLIDALDRAFRSDFRAPDRQHYTVGDAQNAKDTLLIMPAWRTGPASRTERGSGTEPALHTDPAWRTGGCIGVKLVTVFPGNATRGQPAVHATYAMFDAVSGAPVAVLDGTELTRRRTAAASALAARYLANAESSRLLMVGTGSLAPHIIESYALVRPIRFVRVWGRRLERAKAVARAVAGNMKAEAVDDLEAAVRWADIISCATLADVPVVRGAWLRPGQHLDLIGAFTPEMREADDVALTRSSIYVDTRAGALAESGELVQGLAAGVISEADIRGELSELARGTVSGRHSAEEITLFKSVGSAIEDLAAAEVVLQHQPA